MELTTVLIEKPDDLNVFIGQAHFIKTVEDLHETLVGASPVLRFGVAFCEASGPCLIRRSGNDDASSSSRCGTRRRSVQGTRSWCSSATASQSTS